MLLSSPALLPSGALQPRVEPEIRLRLDRGLTAPCSVQSALDAYDAALAYLEILDLISSRSTYSSAGDSSAPAWPGSSDTSVI